QLITKKLHSEDGSTFKQHVDHRYNIRGWLTRINHSDVNIMTDGGPRDYFGMNLGYNDNMGIGNATEQYNGNISAIAYSTYLGLDEMKERGYAFDYDPLNRLKAANHHERDGNWSLSPSFHERGLVYDLNGNILALERRGKDGVNMDSLVYDYTDSGNQLRRVDDLGLDTLGFRDGNTSGDDYVYDPNGNMIVDGNKDIDRKSTR